jgi:hypothetical protein
LEEPEPECKTIPEPNLDTDSKYMELKKNKIKNGSHLLGENIASHKASFGTICH